MGRGDRPDMINAHSNLLQCRYCATEFQIDFKFYTGHGLAMFVTRWKNLLAGLDSDEWKRNFRLQDWLSPATCQKLGLDFRSIHKSGVGFGNETALLRTEHERPLSHNNENPISSAFRDGEEFKYDSLLEPQQERKLLRLNEKYISHCILS
jgi:hypothetical protein